MRRIVDVGARREKIPGEWSRRRCSFSKDQAKPQGVGVSVGGRGQELRHRVVLCFGTEGKQSHQLLVIDSSCHRAGTATGLIWFHWCSPQFPSPGGHEVLRRAGRALGSLRGWIAGRFTLELGGFVAEEGRKHCRARWAVMCAGKERGEGLREYPMCRSLCASLCWIPRILVEHPPPAGQELGLGWDLKDEFSFFHNSTTWIQVPSENPMCTEPLSLWCLQKGAALPKAFGSEFLKWKCSHGITRAVTQKCWKGKCGSAIPTANFPRRVEWFLSIFFQLDKKCSGWNIFELIKQWKFFPFWRKER